MAAESESLVRAPALAAVRELAAAGAEVAYLAELQPRPRWQFWCAPERFVRLTEVYPVGALLLTTAGEIWSARAQVRSVKRERLGVVSAAQERRRDLAGYAFSAGFPAGSTVFYDAEQLPETRAALADSAADPAAPLALDSATETVRVRWRPGAALASAPALVDYLNERLSLQHGL